MDDKIIIIKKQIFNRRGSKERKKRRRRRTIHLVEISSFLLSIFLHYNENEIHLDATLLIKKRGSAIHHIFTCARKEKGGKAKNPNRNITVFPPASCSLQMESFGRWWKVYLSFTLSDLRRVFRHWDDRGSYRSCKKMGRSDFRGEDSANLRTPRRRWERESQMSMWILGYMFI